MTETEAGSVTISRADLRYLLMLVGMLLKQPSMFGTDESYNQAARFEERLRRYLEIGLTSLTAADPQPPRGTVVRDDCGVTWQRDYCEGYWLRADSPDGDPESWAKIAGNYGPVVIIVAPGFPPAA